MIEQSTIDALTVDSFAIQAKIAQELQVRIAQVSSVFQLADEGCTIPFISRYRKEKTGNLDEVQVRDIFSKRTSYTNLEERRIEIIKSIFNQGKLSDDLFENINKCTTLVELEEIYAPYKKKKKTRGMLAIEKGLEPLAEIIQTKDKKAVEEAAPQFICINNEKPELSVASAEEAIHGAMDIIAEKISQNPEYRALIKQQFYNNCKLCSKGIDESKKDASVYQMYWDFSSPLKDVKPHHVLALNRAEREGEISVNLEPDYETTLNIFYTHFTLVNPYYKEAIQDSFERLIAPSVLRELRSDATEHAELHSITVFSTNLKHLLLTPPIKGNRVLGIDPGIRTGTKCAALDETGKFLGYFIINQEHNFEAGKEAVAKAVKEYGIQVIAVGNGTGSSEVCKLVSEAIQEKQLAVQFTVVDEDGASVYSASEIAREEFPELDLTIRGAISIGRRLQDPLAELVKIDPKSIGVGLYQHDVNQKNLSEKLDEVVESVVNNVGVNINTASHALLKYVSGINSLLAKKIVKYRDEKGKIVSREELKNIPGLGDKTFEQCAGFLKIPESENPLDNTWVHPENYALAAELYPLIKEQREITKTMKEQLKSKYGVGETTIEDIILELKKPNRDPRDELPKPLLQTGVLVFEDLKEGMVVKGKVKNVVDFGAFVDIGIKETALVHISEISDTFVKNPLDVIRVGEVREFRIIGLDTIRRRISLSCKSGNKLQSGQDHSKQGKTTSGESAQSGKKVVTVKRKQDQANRSRVNDSDDGSTYNPFAELLKNK